MSFSIGGSKTKSKGTSDTTNSGTSTTSVNAPSWVTDLSGQFAGQIPGLQTQVAGASGLQQDAYNGLSGQNFGGLFGDAANALKAGMGQITADGAQAQIQAKSGLLGVQDWLNPYLGEVVGATQRDLDVNDARTRSQQDLDIAGQKAFGGSGSALTRAFTEGELERARGSTLGGLRMGAFDAAAGNSQQDANRDLQAQIANGGLGNSAADRSLQAQVAGRTLNNQAATSLAGLGQTGIGLQADLGSTQRDIGQEQMDGTYTDMLRKLGLFGLLPSELLTGRTTTENGVTSSKTTGSGTSIGASATVKAPNG